MELQNVTLPNIVVAARRERASYVAVQFTLSYSCNSSLTDGQASTVEYQAARDHLNVPYRTRIFCCKNSPVLLLHRSMHPIILLQQSTPLNSIMKQKHIELSELDCCRSIIGCIGWCNRSDGVGLQQKIRVLQGLL